MDFSHLHVGTESCFAENETEESFKEIVGVSSGLDLFGESEPIEGTSDALVTAIATTETVVLASD